jgi:hypothetical protein
MGGSEALSSAEPEDGEEERDDEDGGSSAI